MPTKQNINLKEVNSLAKQIREIEEGKEFEELPELVYDHRYETLQDDRARLSAPDNKFAMITRAINKDRQAINKIIKLLTKDKTK